MSVADHNLPVIKKVCVIGPECTGKSELSKFLAKHYNTCWVPEYARAYLDKLGRSYQQTDLLKIAHGQLRLEDEWLRDANRVMICDTNLVTIKIWCDYKYGRCDEEILKLIKARHYDLYLLCYIDVPWVNDPQREHPDKREHFWQIFKNEVINTAVPYVEIGGSWEQRQQKAVEAINVILN
ncbi:MAG TPA: ATP-binding protein [Cyclobacteriaceae bacterium]|jgi:NadR type nicotinamide-nucleotide adenylyltransferase|nr:ATP-binding protein [Cyclobacteriaceae bacterium]HNT50929.1 ATP-binding protein [Cyclobacteriaceae bacterium]HRE67654.1 ATP-binding protein [Cyclobacteriaceae bacterium]HRF33807.1 ATP-binding protein [Cyclobacteriaceae bacterium]